MNSLTYFNSYSEPHYGFQADNEASFFGYDFQDPSFNMFDFPDSQLLTCFQSYELKKTNSQPKVTQPSTSNSSENMVESFMDLVNKSSAFWRNKLDDHALKADLINQDNPVKISEKQIKKVSKKQNENWKKNYDSKLLNLVQELGYDWSEIAGAFKESFITAKYVEGRYNKLCRNKSGLRQQYTKEEDLTPAKLYKEDWESFFSSSQPDCTKNDFCSLMQDAIKLEHAEWSPERKELEDQMTRETSSQRSFGTTPVKSQEDIIDSYFNTDCFENFEPQNSPSFEKIDFSEDFEEANQKINFLSSPVKVEEDQVGARLYQEKPKEEVIEILSGRISLIKSLYNQTWMELMKLQRERAVSSQNVM